MSAFGSGHLQMRAYIETLKQPLAEPLLVTSYFSRRFLEKLMMGRLSRSVLTWTMTRDPVSRCLSHFYAIKVGRDGMAPSLENKLAFANSSCTDYQFKFGSPDGCADPACWLGSYDFVGHVERFDESMVALARVARVPLAAVVYVSAHTGCRSGCEGNVSATARLAQEPPVLRTFFASSDFLRGNQRDYALWRGAQQAVAKALLGTAAAETLATFRGMLHGLSEGDHRCVHTEERPCYWYDNGCFITCIDRQYPLTHEDAR